MDENEKWEKFKKDLGKLEWYEFFLLLLIAPPALIYIYLFGNDESNNKRE